MNLPKIKVSYNEDIRRVPMISNEYNLLQKQVKELFEFTESFVMKYKDDEGDMISICTNEELKEAMNNLNNGILRLYVVEQIKKEKRTPKRKCKRNKSPLQAKKDGKGEEDINPFLRDLIPEAEEIEKMINHLPEKIQNFYQGEIKDTIKEFCPYLFEINLFNDKPSANEEIIISQNNIKEEQPKKIIHNAFCDRCDEKIVGLRYKCFECEDFDLCEDCHKVVDGKEDIKSHLKTHRFGKMDTIFSFGFQQEREEHLSLLKMEKEKKEQQEKERIEKEKQEKERLEKENQDKLERERIEKEKQVQQEIERNLVVANESKIIPFDKKLDILNEMGFSDRKKNIQVLIKHKGNLNSAIQDLINL